MCNVDTGVLGQVWYDRKSPRAFPDFNTKHTCKNYEGIRTWAESIQVSSPPVEESCRIKSSEIFSDLTFSMTQAPISETVPDDYTKRPEAGDVLEKIP